MVNIIKNQQYKMKLYGSKCLKFTNGDVTKIKQEKNTKINLYSYCIDCGLKKFETIDEEELSNLLKSLTLS